MAYRKIANALVMPILSVLWLFPLVAISWFYQKPLFIIVAIFVFIVMYGLLYVGVPKIKKKVSRL
jgi:hypothetical protein